MNTARLAAKEAKRNAILDAATELLVKKPTASMNDIAEYAGIGIATLHRYFESRDQLMLLLGLRAVEVVEQTMREIPLDDDSVERYFPELIERLIPLGDKINCLAYDTFLCCSEEMEAAEERLKEPMRQAIRMLQSKGSFRQDMSCEWILNVMYSLVFTAWSMIQQGGLAQKTAASVLIDTVFHGIYRGTSK